MKAIFIFSPLLILAGTAFGQIPTKEEGRFRIAVLACHRQFEPAPALARYLEVEPDLCLWIGDNVYADAPDDPAFIQTCYDALVAKPAFRQLTEQFDYMATWDDHDFGLNDAGKEYRFKAESKAMFRKFWQLEDVIPAGQDGIYYTRHFQIGDKDLQVIMLDVRYNRDAQDGSGDVLGESQWQWLEKQLTEPADLRLIVSGFQILLDREAGSETWDKFPLARRRLFNTIRKNGAQGVFFLTGDQHYGEVCRLRNALDFDAVELQFAGINQIEDPEFNPLRVAPVIRSKHSVAVIDLLLKPTEEEVPHLLFQIADAMTNQTELRYRVNLDEINLQLQFTGPAFFVDQHQIALDHFYPHLEIRYTLDGSEPTAVSQLYTEPFTIDRTTTVNARYFTWDHQVRSPVLVNAMNAWSHGRLQSR
ncbi:MAG: alkaline phosphatase D family protein [Saprospiraceae bacterium]